MRATWPGAKGRNANLKCRSPPRPRVSFRDDLPPVAGMAGLFVVSILLALALAPTFEAAGVQVFEEKEDPTNPIVYLGIVVVFTFLILLLAKLKLKRAIQAIILAAVFLSILYVVQPLVSILTGEIWVSTGIGAAAGVGLVLALYYRPEWYVVDGVGVLVSAGAAAIFGVSVGILPALILLVAFAIYDAIAVYRTKHMLDLADSVLELRLPIMFVMPKHRGYSFLAEKERLKDKLADGKPREAMFLGLGDVVIPGVLVVAAFTSLDAAIAWGPLLVALATLVGTLAGFALLMLFVLRGNPQAGLPSLNAGAIVGFLLATVPLYGWGPVVDPIRALF